MNLQTEISKLNPVAQIAMQCFVDAGFDEPYIFGKVDQLSTKDRWETIFWATHQLDAKNKARFAEKIGVPVEHLLITLETIRAIEFYEG